MAKLEMEIKHSMSLEKGINVAMQLLSETVKDNPDVVSELKEDWNGPTGSFALNALGYEIQGKVSLHADSIAINAKIPLEVTIVRNEIKKAIRRTAKRLMA